MSDPLYEALSEVQVVSSDAVSLQSLDASYKDWARRNLGVSEGSVPNVSLNMNAHAQYAFLALGALGHLGGGSPAFRMFNETERATILAAVNLITNKVTELRTKRSPFQQLLQNAQQQQ